MGNLRQKYTDEEWEELQEEIRQEKENKIKNLLKDDKERTDKSFGTIR